MCWQLTDCFLSHFWLIWVVPILVYLNDFESWTTQNPIDDNMTSIGFWSPPLTPYWKWHLALVMSQGYGKQLEMLLTLKSTFQFQTHNRGRQSKFLDFECINSQTSEWKSSKMSHFYKIFFQVIWWFGLFFSYWPQMASFGLNWPKRASIDLGCPKLASNGI